MCVLIKKYKHINTNNYNVLENALTYDIQRIENDLKKNHNSDYFLIINDEGRLGKMRKIQRINYIPSIIFLSEIELLIEDSLPKASKNSRFIQILDTISYIVYLYCLEHFNNSRWANRVRNKLNFEDVINLLDKIKNNSNIQASRTNSYGIVHYPR
ncbi:hypothetical protein BBF96_12885 [Anoxybacter fermentans]|uniref:Uncharacterized protein n=1 Tax=Anoxybacter fermentans TaxID=1323375 RepID=A0A3S9T0X2_9FIRM|nr:hypothetical protein BBF96_12885 [Anoxybacter fermentans]